MFDKVIIHEVGMRDGLQMESELIPMMTKEMLAGWLLESGIDILQVGSFVNPKKVIQMQDTDDLFSEIKNSGLNKRGALLSALVLNEKGVDRGMNCDVDIFCMGVSASETHSLKNTGMSTKDALTRIIAMAQSVVSAGKRVQVSVQSAFGCGFEGNIDEDKVFRIVDDYFNAGFQNISLADTAGHANPTKVKRMFGKIFEMDRDAEPACHFHNTYGTGLTNIYSAVEAGVKYIETAFGGIGGCPFTKSPSGNVATEDFIHMLHLMGYRQDVNNEKIIKAANHLSNFLMRELPGQVYKIGELKNQIIK